MLQIIHTLILLYYLNLQKAGQHIPYDIDPQCTRLRIPLMHQMHPQTTIKYMDIYFLRLCFLANAISIIWQKLKREEN